MFSKRCHIDILRLFNSKTFFHFRPTYLIPNYYFYSTTSVIHIPFFIIVLLKVLIVLWISLQIDFEECWINSWRLRNIREIQFNQNNFTHICPNSISPTQPIFLQVTWVRIWNTPGARQLNDMVKFHTSSFKLLKAHTCFPNPKKLSKS